MRNETKLAVCDKYIGMRADIFLSESIVGLTRSAAGKLLAGGYVTCRGVPVRKNDRLKANDIVMCAIPTPATYAATAEDIPLDIIHEDADIIVINKPRSLVVHPAAGHFSGTLVNALLHHCGGSLSGIGGVQRPGIVHRLDKDTSGVMVVAKNDAAHQSLSTQLANRQMGRVYQAVTIGRVKTETQTVNIPIGRHPIDRKKMAVFTRHDGRCREALTHLTVLEQFSRFTLLQARLETGRTHQIRVHLAHIGYPVLGDVVYGPKKQPFNTDGQVLHAKLLILRHPRTGEEMVFDAPLPDYFTKAVLKCAGTTK